MKTFWRLVLLLMLIVICAPVAYGASSVYLEHTSGGNFTLNASNLPDVESVQITVGYNASILTPPATVSQGTAFGFFASNPNVPGVIQISATNRTAVNGNILIANLSFPSYSGTIDNSAIWIQSSVFSDKTGSPVGVINKGLSNPEQANAQNNGNNNSNDTGSGTGDTQGANTTTTTAGSQGTGTTFYPGTISTITGSEETGNAETPHKEETTEHAEAAPTPAETPSAPAAKGGDGGKGATPEKTARKSFSLPGYPGVLASFRSFRGEQTPKEMEKLATAEMPKGLRQVPAMLLSDGKSTVKVYIHIPADVKVAPTFALRGAKLVSLKRVGADWVVEALPKANAYDVSVSVLHDDTVSVVPLTVAPSLDRFIARGLAMDEQGFALFLKERGTEKAPKFDLNGDGKRTYVDDYIYTVNYLIRTKKADLKKVAPKKVERKKK